MTTLARPFRHWSDSALAASLVAVAGRRQRHHDVGERAEAERMYRVGVALVDERRERGCG